MKRFIREYAPFIILGYNTIFAVGSYFGFYKYWLDYFLGDLFGYSVFTNLFMLTVYMNKKYCAATKICVIGLIALNLSSIIYKVCNINGLVYDIYLLVIVSLVLIIKKL